MRLRQVRRTRLWRTPKGQTTTSSHVVGEKPNNWNHAKHINCPNGGSWRVYLVETLTAEQVAKEEGEILRRCGG